MRNRAGSSSLYYAGHCSQPSSCIPEQSELRKVLGRYLLRPAECSSGLIVSKARGTVGALIKSARDLARHAVFFVDGDDREIDAVKKDLLRQVEDKSQALLVT